MLKTLLPRTRAQLFSPINGEIKVVEYYNGPCVWVDGIQQSGPYIKKYWQKVFEEISLNRFKSVLILGFGAGSAYTTLRESNGSLKITGVELDPEMINIAQTYFGVTKDSKTKLIASDAHKYLKGNKDKFDLVIIDLYLGSEDKVSKDIISLSKKHLNRSGLILLNSYQDKEWIKSLLPKPLKIKVEIHFNKNSLLVLN